MRVVVVGATGNVGSSLLRLLAADPRVESVLGVARRRPNLDVAKVEWASADVAVDDLHGRFRGADAVVHLAWLIQPSHRQDLLHRVNVEGSGRVFDAAASAGVPALVYASSVGAYSPGAKDTFVDESWPTGGLGSSFYARHKAEVERRLDEVERAHPELRVVRLRPALIFKRTAACGIRRLFAGPLLPGAALRPRLVPFVPDIDGFRVQGVHTDDVAQAYVEATVRDVRGPFNIAAGPPIDTQTLARIFDARPIRLRPAVARAAVSVLWRLRIQPTPPGWLDLALAVPLMSSGRARDELGWAPSKTAEQALTELLDGLRSGAEEGTAPLARHTGGPLRLGELPAGTRHL